MGGRGGMGHPLCSEGWNVCNGGGMEDPVCAVDCMWALDKNLHYSGAILGGRHGFVLKMRRKECSLLVRSHFSKAYLKS